MSYIGKAPGFGIRNRYYYTATASQTLFSGADDNGQTLAYADSKYLDVFLNGVSLVAGTDYTATTLTSVSLTSGAAADDIIEIVAYDIFSVADTVSASNGGTFNGAVTVDSTLTASGLVTAQDGLTVDNDGATVATFDRATSDGTIVDLQKDGSSVGSIGVADSGDRIYLAGPGLEGVGIDNGANAFVPTSEAGAFKDGHLALGRSDARFTNLYLSGGVYLGGTGAVNKLEDYEEGEWTPTYNASGASPSVTYSTRQGRYRKIGNMVVVSWHLRASAYTAGSGDLQITGLPFAASSETSMGNFGTINFEQLNFSTGRTMAVAFIADTQDYIFFQEQGDSVDVRTLQSADLTGSIRMIRGTVTYLTDS